MTVDPPPLTGSVVQVTVTAHEGQTGARLTAHHLGRRPVFKKSATAGDAHSLIAAIGPSGKSDEIKARFGFVGSQLVHGGHKEALFFLRATVTQGGMPVSGNSEQFMLQARKKTTDEVNGTAKLKKRERAEAAGGWPAKKKKQQQQADNDEPAPPPPPLPLPLLSAAPPPPPPPAGTKAPAKNKKRTPRTKGGVPKGLDRMESLAPPPLAPATLAPAVPPPPEEAVQNECARGFAWLAGQDEADAAEQAGGLP